MTMPFVVVVVASSSRSSRTWGQRPKHWRIEKGRQEWIHTSSFCWLLLCVVWGVDKGVSSKVDCSRTASMRKDNDVPTTTKPQKKRKTHYE